MGTVIDSVIWYPYGMAGNTPVGSFGLTFSGTADQENQITLPYSWDNRFLGLKSGEVMLGNPVKQTSIKFDEDGNVTINTKGNLTVNGDLIVTGNITALNGSVSMSGIQDNYNEHTHITDGVESSTPEPQI